jgi:hypothetical protein
MIQIRKAQERDHANHGWLDARIGKIIKRRENRNETLRHRKTLREIWCSTKESKQAP